jgi:hypothetical protein
MRVFWPILLMGLAACGFTPHPQNGALPCDNGCPSGYHCAIDGTCRTTDLGVDGSSPKDGRAAETGVASDAPPASGDVVDRFLADGCDDLGRAETEDGSAGPDAITAETSDTVAQVDSNVPSDATSPLDGSSAPEVDGWNPATSALDASADVSEVNNSLDIVDGKPLQADVGQQSPDGVSTDLVGPQWPNGVDTAPPDLMQPMDGSVESPSKPPILCPANGSLLLDDSFDHSSTVTAAGWSTYLAGGSAMSLDQSVYLSPPGSALAALPANSQMGNSAATMSTSFSATPHNPTAHFAFDVQVAAPCLQPAPTPGLVPPSLQIGDVMPAMQYEISLTIVPNGSSAQLQLQEFSGIGNLYPVTGQQPIAIGAWQHIDLQLRFAGEPVGWLSVAGGPPQVFSLHPSGGAAFGDEMVGVSVGAYLMGPANACNVHYDNVQFSMPSACAQ